MSDTYEINDRDEVIPYTSGRRCNDTRAWRDATELEIQQRDEIARLESEVEKLEAKIDDLQDSLANAKLSHEEGGKEQRIVSPFACSFAEFKEQSGQFFKRLKANPSPTPNQVDNGFKAIGIAYLNMEGSEMEKHQARIVLDLATRASLDFEANSKHTSA